ncbi:hypothetical protein DX933_17880 [Ornithinibacillus gellani]|uniref:hypothetical protein n=1 Tax=Ornithinibacillus gellani TaxID=2293253 RepID=UPI000F4AB4E8|nr:hypothetical protein [Ornithinibacillus gellani]TQS70629.1 hypothetical protein DX933_17880 [Ornithinibacillus gellani]
MGRQIKGLLYFFVMDIRYSLMIFWTILISLLAVSLAISHFLESAIASGSGVFTFVLTGPIYVYCAIIGFLTVRDYIPYSLKLGATRKSIFVSIGIFFFGLAFAKSVAATIIQAAVEKGVDLFGMKYFIFLHPAQLLTDTWYNRLIIDTSISFFFAVLLFLIGLIFYRFGLAGGGSALGIVGILLLIGLAKGWVFDFAKHVFTTFDMVFFAQLFGVALVIYAVTFVLVRKISIFKVK